MRVAIYGVKSIIAIAYQTISYNHKYPDGHDQPVGSKENENLLVEDCGKQTETGGNMSQNIYNACFTRQ